MRSYRQAVQSTSHSLGRDIGNVSETEGSSGTSKIHGGKYLRQYRWRYWLRRAPRSIKNFLYLKIYSLSIPPSSRFVRLICIGYSVSDFYATSVLGLTAFTPTDDSTLSGRTSLNVFSARFIAWHRCSCLKQKINIEKDTAKRKKAERFEKKKYFRVTRHQCNYITVTCRICGKGFECTSWLTSIYYIHTWTTDLVVFQAPVPSTCKNCTSSSYPKGQYNGTAR